MAITYQLPENKPYKEVAELNAASEDSYYRPCVYLEISPEQLKALTIGDNIEVKLTGLVKGLEMREHAGGKSRYELDLEVSTITIPSENVFTKMVDEEEEEYA
jgi:hypothetical protein